MRLNSRNTKMLLSLSSLVLLLNFPLLLLLFFYRLRKTVDKPNLPPGPKGLPIIGNLHQLNSSSLYLDLWNLSKKYGPLFSLKLGHRTVIVVSSPKMAKETLKNHDVEFSDRPSLFSQQKLSYNAIELIFSSYGDYWREIRKICVVHVFNAKRVSSFSSIRHYEVQHMIQKISTHAASSKVTNLNELVLSVTSAIICRATLGKRYEEEGVERSRFHGMLDEFQAMMGSFFLQDYIHFTEWIDRLRGLTSRHEKNYKELDAFYKEVIDEHLNPQRQKPQEEEDIVDVLLHLKKQRWFSFDLTFDHIKALIMDILAAATDTSTAVSVWAMTQLMKNPKVMQKVQEEVRNICGSNKGFIEEAHIQKFTYLKVVVKETLRLHPPAPLLVMRQTNKKCIIEGYEIPAKTSVYVNAWAIHRDPEAWKDPEVFNPERFLDSAIDFKGQDFELIPFGAGRRICPGLPMGIATIELILANLAYSFDWEMPKGMKREDIDFEVLPGITQHKKNPLCLVPKNHMF